MRLVSKNKGFTLVELMVAVAILGILASIVLPSYQDYLRIYLPTDPAASQRASLPQSIGNTIKDSVSTEPAAEMAPSRP